MTPEEHSNAIETEWREKTYRDRQLCIELTTEQAMLYQHSTAFRSGVNAFILTVAPAFLAGLEANAEAADEDMRARMRAAMGGYYGLEG